jgi:hypothetical protein
MRQEEKNAGEVTRSHLKVDYQCQEIRDYTGNTNDHFKYYFHYKMTQNVFLIRFDFFGLHVAAVGWSVAVVARHFAWLDLIGINCH